jgi:hypothetical protein
MKKLVDLLKELEEKALDISWNPYEEKALKDGQSLTFTIRYSRSGGKAVYKFEGWSLLEGWANETSEADFEEIKSQYIGDCRAEAGVDKYDEDYDCDDIPINRYEEDQGYYTIIDSTFSIGHENSYYLDNRYEFTSEILKVLQTENPSVEELYKYMI